MEQEVYKFSCSHDFYSSNADSCVFYTLAQPLLIVVIFVDDGLVINKDSHQLQTMLGFLREHFEITTGLPTLKRGLAFFFLP